MSRQAIAVVTGGTGYVGTELVKQLLEKGYHVRTTVRDVTAKDRLATLTKLGEALPGTLELAQADLLAPGSFDEVVKGADVVFHVASPFFIKSDNPQEDLIDPAVKGTENVLGSVARASPRPRRVVLTSSIAAVTGDTPPGVPKNGSVYTPEDWNETSTIEKEPYLLSKTLAERAAWRIAGEHRLDLVTVLPCFVMGPVLDARAAGTSRGFFAGILEGASEPEGSARLVDVRDVARAHVLAAETPGAKGRYFATSASAIPWASVLGWLSEAYPYAGFPPAPVDLEQPAPSADPSATQRELGLEFTPAKETILDMARTLLALGAATLKGQAGGGGSR